MRYAGRVPTERAHLLSVGLLLLARHGRAPGPPAPGLHQGDVQEDTRSCGRPWCVPQLYPHPIIFSSDISLGHSIISLVAVQKSRKFWESKGFRSVAKLAYGGLPAHLMESSLSFLPLPISSAASLAPSSSPS